MLQNLALLPYLIGFFLFGLGLFVCGQLAGEIGFNLNSSTSQQHKIPLRPLRFILAIIIFSAFSNAVLLFPALLEALFGLNASIAIRFHQVGIVVLAGCVLALVGIGSVAVLRVCGWKLDVFNKYKHFRPVTYILKNSIQIPELLFVALAVSFYYYNTLGSGYVYDTGLYHFPFVKHLVHFGAEIGLANFHSRYGFYNIQLFGQVPIQSLAFGETLVAPSLNILFLAAFLMFAYASIMLSVSSRHMELAPARDSHFGPWIQTSPISTIAYWIALFSFGLTSKSSLISYDADFSASIVASILCYSFIVGGFLNSEILILAASMPLLKLSGIVAILYVLLFIGSVGLCKTILLRHPIRFSGAARNLKSIRISWGLPASIILSLYVIFFSTNLALTGYLVFPQYKTGPIGDHAVPYQDVAVLKDRWITGWARFRFDAEPREVRANAPLGTWLPQFIRSGSGNTILFWIGSSFFVAACSIVGMFFKRNKPEFIVLFSSAISAGVVSALVLLALPPDPRFYAWINGLIAFNSIQLIVLAPVSGIIAFSMLIVAASMALRNRVAKMEVPELKASEFTREAITSAWKTRANPGQSNIIIRQPTKRDQCWSAEPPCSPYEGFLKPTNESEQLEIR
jgi:hypothetical protein